MSEAIAATPEAGTAPEVVAPKQVSRDEAQSVNFAAERIAGLIGAEEPTENPGGEPEPPRPEAAEQDSTDEGEKSEAKAEGDEPDAEKSEDESKDAEADEQKPELPSTLDEIAAAFEIERAALDDIKVAVKINGENEEVTLAEALNGYSRTQDYTRKTTELSEQSKAFEQAVTEAEAELQSRATRLATLTQTLEQQLTGAEPNWAELQKNPQAYLQAQREWQQKTQALQSAQVERNRLVQQQMAQQQEQMQQHLAEEHKRMVTNWPELSDPKGQAASEMRSYLAERGFNEQEINALADHRLIGVLKDAVNGKKVSSSNPEKKLVKPTRTIKPGTPRNGEDAKAEKVAAARRNHRRNPRSLDAAAERINRIFAQ
jgi:DNA repair exonuclease SbcCD ATPase subunit